MHFLAENKAEIKKWIALFMVTISAGFTYLWHYWEPNKPYWDEHYYVADAQKYLNRIHFVQMHPPFAKLLIAAGEFLVHANEKNDQSIDKVKIGSKDVPPEFSMVGYRLFPVLLGWLTAPLLFLIMRRISS